MWSSQRLKAPPSAQFFAALMVTGDGFHQGAEEALSEAFGPLDRHSLWYEFSRFSTYYDREMGGPVWKYFVTFKRLLPVDLLVDVKLQAEEIQRRFAISEKDGPRRTVNVDPGYLTGWNLVLSTVKNHAHRLYLGQGVYAEVTLVFRHHQWEALPWTYPDYCSKHVIDFFTLVRSDYLKRLGEANSVSSRV